MEVSLLRIQILVFKVQNEEKLIALLSWLESSFLLKASATKKPPSPCPVVNDLTLVVTDSSNPPPWRIFKSFWSICTGDYCGQSNNLFRPIKDNVPDLRAKTTATQFQSLVV
ncbi:hypothetical protein Tco_1112075 [Tanacetum coccineum]|uniref:Uncharacterized protein n=1 Tax=Tanacetum coccineum TaxID=301880 RepID=A0ABQ5INF3_9ASTR